MSSKNNTKLSAKNLLILIILVAFILPSCKLIKPSIEELKKKAMQGDVWSQNALAKIYFTGNGTDVNYPEYFKWIKMAADSGDAKAQFFVADAYNKGIGISIDHNKAFEYFMKSANNGNETAQHLVAFCYAKGMGVQEDLEKSIMWYIISNETRQKGSTDLDVILYRKKKLYPEVYDKANIKAQEWIKNNKIR